MLEAFFVVNKRLMRSSVDQPKVNSNSDVHVWHALWHALGDIAGKTGPVLHREYLVSQGRGQGYD